MLKLPIRYTRRCFLILLSLADSSFWLLGCYRVKEKNVLTGFWSCIKASLHSGWVVHLHSCMSFSGAPMTLRH